MDCLFCKIVNREIKADIVYEDEGAMGLLDINPRAPGHIFVIPKSHTQDLLTLPEEQVEGLFKAVKRVGSSIKEKLKADALTIGINNGRVSGQEIDHLHIHIMPRFKGDRGNSIQSVVNNPPTKEDQERLRRVLMEEEK